MRFVIRGVRAQSHTTDYREFEQFRDCIVQLLSSDDFTALLNGTSKGRSRKRESATMRAPVTTEVGVNRESSIVSMLSILCVP
jgi:hypothetical protein